MDKRVSISSTFTVITVEDGKSADFYTDEWYAWSSVSTTVDTHTSPFPAGTTPDPWSRSVPERDGTKPYLWRKSIQHQWSAEEQDYIDQQAQYVRISGDNGTSISIKGRVIAVAQSVNALPQSSANNDLGLVYGQKKVFKYNSSTTPKWTEDVTKPVADGDCYVNDTDNNLYMWSEEAGDWQNIGQFQGDDGATYYHHVAWATDVTLASSQQDIPEGQKSRPNATSVTGFSTSPWTSGSNSQQRPWMGYLVDSTEADSTVATKYTWSYIKGAKGDTGESPWTLIVRNQADCVSCDSTGKPKQTDNKYTNIELFHGSTHMDITSVDISMTPKNWAVTNINSTTQQTNGDSTGYVYGYLINGGTARVGINFNTSYQFAATAEMSITAYASSGQAVGTFSVSFANGGTNGSDAEIYSLVPSTINIVKHADGSATPAGNVTCGVIKTKGATTSTPTSGFYLRMVVDNGSEQNYAAVYASNVATGIEYYLYNSSTKSVLYDHQTVWVLRDGTSPYFADIDNEMDSVACLNNGKVDTSSGNQVVYTTPALFNGSTKIPASDTTISVRDNTPQGASYSNDMRSQSTNVLVSWSENEDEISFNFNGDVQFDSTNRKVFCIGLTATINGDSVTRYVYLTVNGVRAAKDGTPATLYSLVPAVTQIVKRQDGTYVPSAAFTCGVVKTVGGVESTPASTEYKLYRNLNGGGFNEIYTSTQTNPSSVSSNVVFRLDVKNASNQWATIDVETIPLVKDGLDGAHGTSPYFADLDNEMDSVSCTYEGKLDTTSVQVLQTNVSMYRGSTKLSPNITIKDGNPSGHQYTNNTAYQGVTVYWENSGSISMTFAVNYTFQERRVFCIILDADGVTRELYFVANCIRAAKNGDNAVVFRLVPSVDKISKRKNGDYDPARGTAITCGVTKTVGGVTSAAASSEYLLKMSIDGGDERSYTSTLVQDISSSIKYNLYVPKSTPNTKVDTENIPVIIDGDDGTSPYYIDLDNEMDSVLCDADGVVRQEQFVDTYISLWKGESPISISSTNISCQVSNGNTSASISSSYKSTGLGYYYKYSVLSSESSSTKIKLRFYVRNGTDLQPTGSVTATASILITASVSDGGNTVNRTAIMTIAAAKEGDDGKPATIYNLVPSQSSINITRSSSGGYTPNKTTLKCGYTKNVGGSMTVSDDAVGNIDNKYRLFFRRRSRSNGNWELTYYYYGDSTYNRYLVETTGYSSSGLDVSTYDKVEFILYEDTSSRSITATLVLAQKIIDKESVPVISDGKDGSSPYQVDLDNEMDTVLCDADGDVTQEQHIDSTLTLWKGATQLPLAANEVTFMVTDGDSEATITDKYGSQGTIAYYYKAEKQQSGNAINIKVFVREGTPLAHTTTQNTFVRVKMRISTRDAGATVERTAIMTIAGAKAGAEGQPAVKYSLIPSASSVVYNPNSQTYSPSTVYCSYSKFAGEQEVTPPDGAVIYYMIDNGLQEFEYTTSGVSAGADGFTSKVTFLLKVNNRVVDKETVPVVKDGTNGDKGDDSTWYEIRTTIETIKIPKPQTSVTTDVGAWFYEHSGNSAERNVTLYYGIYRRKGQTYQRKAYGQANVAGVESMSFSTAEYDALVFVVGNTSFYSYSSTIPNTYLAKKEVAVIADGNDGDSAHFTRRWLQVTPETIDLLANGRTEVAMRPRVEAWEQVDNGTPTRKSESAYDDLFIYYTGVIQNANNTYILSAPKQYGAYKIEADYGDNEFVWNNWGWETGQMASANAHVIETLEVTWYVDSTKTAYYDKKEIVVNRKGDMGRNYYYAGEYDQNEDYLLTDYEAPFVSYDDGNITRYYVRVGVSGTTSTIDPWNDNDGICWALMTSDFKYIITEALFSDFAKLGSSVFNKDYMFSQYCYAKGFGGIKMDIPASSYSSATYYNKIDPNDVFGEGNMYVSSQCNIYDIESAVSGRNADYDIQNTSWSSSVCSLATSPNIVANEYYTLQLNAYAEQGTLYFGVAQNVSGSSLVNSIASGSITTTLYNSVNSYYYIFKARYSGKFYVYFKCSPSYLNIGVQDVYLRPCKYVPQMAMNLLTGKVAFNNIVANGTTLPANTIQNYYIHSANNYDVLPLSQESIVTLGYTAVNSTVILPVANITTFGRVIEVFNGMSVNNSWFLSWRGMTAADVFLNPFSNSALFQTTNWNGSTWGTQARTSSLAGITYVKLVCQSISNRYVWVVLKAEAVVVMNNTKHLIDIMLQ